MPVTTRSQTEKRQNLQEEEKTPTTEDVPVVAGPGVVLRTPPLSAESAPTIINKEKLRSKVSSRASSVKSEHARRLALARMKIAEAKLKTAEAKQKSASAVAEQEASEAKLEIAVAEMQLVEAEILDEENDCDSVISEYENTRVQKWLEDYPKEDLEDSPVHHSSPAAVKKEVPSFNNEKIQQIKEDVPKLAPTFAATEQPSPSHQQQIGVNDLAAAFASAARALQPPRFLGHLPEFNGRLHEWLAFKCAYTETESNFSALENIARLRRALKGRAKEAVHCLLISNAKPEEVMSTLEMRFGRTDAIAKSEIDNLRNLPKITDSALQICIFASKVKNSVATIKALKRTQYLANPEIVQNVVDTKLPQGLRYRWVDFNAEQSEDEPELAKFSRFIEREAEKFGKIAPPEVISEENAVHRPRIHRTFKLEETRQEKKREISKKLACPICKNDHVVTTCSRMKQADSDGRWSLAKEFYLCFRCLRQKTMDHRCKTNTCEVHGCKRTHHPMLHYERKSPTAKSETQTEVVASTNCTRQGCAYLKMVPVRIAGPKGHYDTLALLDDGSTITLIDAEVASRIGAIGISDPLHLEGVAGSKINAGESQRVNITLKGQTGHYNIKARTITELQLAPQAVKISDLEGCHHLEGLEDHLRYEEAKPKILIGQDNWHLLVAKQFRRGQYNQPVASLTALGWVLHGTSSRSLNRTVHYVYRVGEDFAEEEIRRFFTLDSLGVQPKLPKSDPEARALRVLEENTIKRIEGGYETCLLWKNDNVALPNNYNGALNRLQSIEKKLDRNPELKESYEAQIHKLIDKGYAEKVIGPPTQGKTWYLPHFAVTHPNKPGKVRVVLDAAFRFGNTSLNDNLLSGPDLLQSLQGVLMRFRQHRIAIAADIEEMFLRISIKKEDRDALRFLWREDRREGPPTEYRMKTVIFGATCSPCTALYVKDLNAERHRDRHPEAAEAIIQNHYMDDYLQSFSSIEEAQKIAQEVNSIHKEANFYLRKWTSNCKEAIAKLADTTEVKELQFDDGAKEEKILGLIWRPATDCLAFNLNFNRVPSDIINGNRIPTKREALRTTMSIFDPLGIASPIVIQAKYLLQETWRAGIGWDEELPPALENTWNRWIKDLEQLREIAIPRCHLNLTNGVEREIHTFVDASERAYAAAVYWRVVDDTGTVHVSLAAAKARVAPIKLTSIPRLELQAALMGSRLANTVITEYNIKPDRCHYWSDSKTVLAWLRAGPRTFKPYVAHRIAEIQETTNIKQWRWVPTSQNVADDATRDTPKQFNSQHRWFVGPQFLTEHSDRWPEEQDIKTGYITGDSEARVNTTRKIPCNNLRESLPDVNRFSSWTRLIRATAFVLKFIQLLLNRRKHADHTVNYKRTVKNSQKDPQWGKTPCRKNAATKRTNSQNCSPESIRLEVALLKEAELLWIKSVQQENFAEDIEALKSGEPIPKNSRLDQRTKFYYDAEIIRIKSRIAAVENITSNQKEPAVLDGNHRYTKLYLASIHEKLAHAGIETTVNEARQHYWIVRLRPVTRTVVKQCMKCRLRRAAPAEPPTGDHPRSRLAHHKRPFTFTGLDYFGPLSVTVGRQHQKRYVALFTCLTTRAVHLELVASLSTDSAIMALRRMIARRGEPTEIYSDNGTNFHGADRELREAMKSEATKRSIIWRYIPPGAPFMGGAWERLVRSVKVALNCILHEQHPREEVLSTLLCEAEYIVNSRPLTHVSTSPEDDEAITPNHFLMGGSGRVQTPGSFSELDGVSRQQWRRAQVLADQFWTRWLREYLPDLQYRREPYGHGTPLRIDDLVLIVDSNLPRNTWPRGRIVAVYPGPDGVVRTADVKTRGGILRRPTKKLVILQIQKEE